MKFSGLNQFITCSFLCFAIVQYHSLSLAKKKCWNNINFKITEKLLLNSPVVKITTLIKYKNKPYIYLVELTNGLKAVFKPDRPILEQISSLRAYHLSQSLNLKLIPPTVRRKINEKSGVLQLFIEGNQIVSPPIDLTSSQKALTYLFYTIIGDVDDHGNKNNMILGANCKKLALIDNDRNLDNLLIIQYRDFYYMRGVTVKNKVLSNFSFSDYLNFPFEKAKSIDPKFFSLSQFKKLCTSVGINCNTLYKEDYIEISNDLTSSIYYVTFKNNVWFKYNMKPVEFLYKGFSSQAPSKKILKKFKKLKYNHLYSFKNTLRIYFNSSELNEVKDLLDIFDKFVIYRKNALLKEITYVYYKKDLKDLKRIKLILKSLNNL